MPSQPKERNAVTRQVFLGAAAAGLAGLNRVRRARGTRSLTLWSYAQGEDCGTWLNGQVAAFQRAYPFLRVTVVTKDPATQHNDLRAAQAAGITPDLCLMDAALLGSFVSKGPWSAWSASPTSPIWPGCMCPATWRRPALLAASTACQSTRSPTSWPATAPCWGHAPCRATGKNS